MLFNPDPSKQAIEICFFHNRQNKSYSSLVFNDTKVQLAKARNIRIDFRFQTWF